MSQKTITYLTVIGAILIIGIVAINKASDVLKDHTNIAWFILGFGACLFFEGVLWGTLRLLKRCFPDTFN